jgi:hypothetical protein
MVWLSRIWSGWRSALAIVRPETVVAWHRKGFRLFWTWKVRHGEPGRPPDFKPWLFLRGVRFMDCLCACILRHTHARGRIQDRHHCVLDDLILQRSGP